MNKVQKQLTALQQMSVVELQALWPRYFNHPPKRTQQEHLVSQLSYKIQEKIYGGLSKTIRNKLERMAFGEQQQSQPRYHLSQGTQLIREWNRKRYTVIVTEGGFQYEGKIYRSLSNVACEITGTRWSGPLFFGLKKQKGSHEKTT